MSTVSHHSQFELFPGTPGSTTEKTKTGLFLKNLTLSIENLVVLGVVIIMSMVVSYSLGVERGKKVVLAKHIRVPTSREASDLTHSPMVSAADSNPKVGVERGGRAGVVPQPSVVNEDTRKEVNIETQLAAEKVVDKVYTIQVASFRKERHAHKEALVLEKKGYDTLVLPKGKYSIVCVGKFAKMNEAKNLAQKLKKTYKDNIIRSL